MKRMLLSLAALLAFAVLIATTFNSSSAQNYNWPAERALRRKIINDAILRQTTDARRHRQQSQTHSSRRARHRHRA